MGLHIESQFRRGIKLPNYEQYGFVRADLLLGILIDPESLYPVLQFQRLDLHQIVVEVYDSEHLVAFEFFRFFWFK